MSDADRVRQSWNQMIETANDSLKILAEGDLAGYFYRYHQYRDHLESFKKGLSMLPVSCEGQLRIAAALQRDVKNIEEAHEWAVRSMMTLLGHSGSA